MNHLHSLILTMAILHDQPNKSLHKFQLSRSEQVAPVLRGEFLSSCFFLKSPVLRWSWLECQIFIYSSSQSHFLQTDCENFGSIKIRWVQVLLLVTIFIMSNRSKSTKTLFVWALVKEVPGTGLWINTVCNF